VRQSFEKRVILISGANGGIGTAVAKELMACDYELSLGSRSGFKENPFASLVATNKIHSAVFDAQSESDADAWVSSVYGQYGRLDAIVNCIGTLSSYNFGDTSFAELDRIIDVNLKGPIRLIRAAYPHLKNADNPKIINLVSLSGLRVAGKSAGYAISKFALRALGHSVRFYGWNDKVRVTSLCPGWVNTQMVNSISPLDGAEMTQPEDIGKIVRLLVELPPTCSISELAINCVLEPYF